MVHSDLFLFSDKKPLFKWKIPGTVSKESKGTKKGKTGIQKEVKFWDTLERISGDIPPIHLLCFFMLCYKICYNPYLILNRNLNKFWNIIWNMNIKIKLKQILKHNMKYNLKQILKRKS